MTDILDLIDNVTQNLCACGCGTQLADDGPSAWFASQDCQGSWADSHATDPDDVYDRDDAGDGWMYDAVVTGQPAADHAALIDFVASTVNPEAIRGRRGIITAAEDTRVWIGEQEVTNWVVPGSIRIQLHTSTPDNGSVIRLSAAESAWHGWSAVDEAMAARLNDLPDASVTITGYWDPPPVNITPIMDEICCWLDANRIDYRSVPIEAVPLVFENRIFCPVYVRTPAGELWVDRRSDSVRSKMTCVRLRVPPPSALKPWLASGRSLPALRWLKDKLACRRMHMAYGRRLRSRRRRGRR